MKSKPRKHILDGLGKAARPLNFPPEQLESFVAAGYVPQRKQLKFHAAARLCDRPDRPSQFGFGGDDTCDALRYAVTTHVSCRLAFA